MPLVCITGYTLMIRAKKLQQFTKLCKGDMSQNSKTAKMVLGRYYRVLNSRLALTRLAIFTCESSCAEIGVNASKRISNRCVESQKVRVRAAQLLADGRMISRH